MIACVAGGFVGERARDRGRAKPTKPRNSAGGMGEGMASPLVFAASPLSRARSPTKPPATQARVRERDILDQAGHVTVYAKELLIGVGSLCCFVRLTAYFIFQSRTFEGETRSSTVEYRIYAGSFVARKQ